MDEPCWHCETPDLLKDETKEINNNNNETYVLFGYLRKEVSLHHQPGVKIYGIYSSEKECINRINYFTEGQKHIVRNNGVVVYTHKHVFWLKKNKGTEFIMHVSNLPDTDLVD